MTAEPERIAPPEHVAPPEHMDEPEVRIAPDAGAIHWHVQPEAGLARDTPDPADQAEMLLGSARNRGSAEAG